MSEPKKRSTEQLRVLAHWIMSVPFGLGLTKQARFAIAKLARYQRVPAGHILSREPDHVPKTVVVEGGGAWRRRRNVLPS
jgi:hypothetical protein